MPSLMKNDLFAGFFGIEVILTVAKVGEKSGCIIIIVMIAFFCTEIWL
jgi:hypothetical protein